MKICVLGGGAVGKSALTVRFVQGVFVKKYDPTIEDSYRRSLDVGGEQVVLEILDTAGTENFSAMRDLYMKEGDGYVFVYSIVSNASFNEIVDMRDQLERVRDGKYVPSILLGNKCDLDDARIITKKSGQERARQWDMPFMETSALTGDCIHEAFRRLVQDILVERAKAPYLKQNKQRTNKACTLL